MPETNFFGRSGLTMRRTYCAQHDLGRIFDQVDTPGRLDEVVDLVAAHAQIDLDRHRTARTVLGLEMNAAVLDAQQFQHLLGHGHEFELLRVRQARRNALPCFHEVGFARGVVVAHRPELDLAVLQQHVDVDLVAVDVLLGHDRIAHRERRFHVRGDVVAQVVDRFPQFLRIVHAHHVSAAGAIDRLHHHRVGQAGDGGHRIGVLRNQGVTGRRQPVLAAEGAEQVLVAGQARDFVGYADQPEAVTDARREQDVVFPERDDAVGAQLGVLREKVLHGPERCRVVAGISQDPVRRVRTAPVFRGVQDDQLAAQIPQPLECKSLLAVTGVDDQQVLALDIPGS